MLEPWDLGARLGYLAGETLSRENGEPLSREDAAVYLVSDLKLDRDTVSGGSVRAQRTDCEAVAWSHRASENVEVPRRQVLRVVCANVEDTLVDSDRKDEVTNR